MKLDAFICTANCENIEHVEITEDLQMCLCLLVCFNIYYIVTRDNMLSKRRLSGCKYKS